MTLTVLEVMFIAGWLAVMGVVFVLHNKRQHYTELSRTKRVFVYAGFAFVAVMCAQVSIVIFFILAVQFCTPPGCF